MGVKRKKMIDGTQLMKIFEERIVASGSLTAVAKELGFSQPYLHQVLTGKRGISDKLALKLDFKAVMHYLKVTKKT